MNLTALSGPEPTIGPGILAAFSGIPPFTLPLAAATDAMASSVTLPGDTIPFAVPAMAIGEQSIEAEECPPPQLLTNELPTIESLAAQKAATPKRACSGLAETITTEAPASPQPSTSVARTIEIPPVSNGDHATVVKAPELPASPEGDRDPIDAEAPEDHSVPVPGFHQTVQHLPHSTERDLAAHVIDRPGLQRPRRNVPTPTPEDDRVSESAIVSTAIPADTSPGNNAVADPVSPSLKPAESHQNRKYETTSGEPQARPAVSLSGPAPSGLSPTPPQSAASFAHTPSPRTAPEAMEASTQAPGLDRADKSPPASSRAVERRSARATERVIGPEQAAPPTDAPFVATADSKAAINHVSPLADAAAPTPQPAAPQPLVQRDVAPATEPAPRLHLDSRRFAEEVGIAIARRPGGLMPGDELVLQIEPANMGRIRVELRFAPDGGLEAVLSADHHRVFEQLRAHGADLHRGLIEAGGRADIAPPRFEARSDNNAGLPATGGQTTSGGQGQAGQQQGHGQHHARAATPYPVDLSAPATSSRLRPVSATRRLDLIA